jgi:hypothetical protein
MFCIFLLTLDTTHGLTPALILMTSNSVSLGAL